MDPEGRGGGRSQREAVDAPEGGKEEESRGSDGGADAQWVGDDDGDSDDVII